MKKVMVLICAVLFLGASTAHPCRHGRQLKAITHKLYKIINRCECNCMHNRDPLEAAELINDYRVLYDKICDDCKEFAQEHTKNYIEQIMTYFGLD